MVDSHIHLISILYILDHFKEVVGPALEAGSVRLRLVPAYYIPSAPLLKPGIMVLGDALSCRSAITASGITSALKDIQLWTDILKEMDSLGELIKDVDVDDWGTWQHNKSILFFILL